MSRRLILPALALAIASIVAPLAHAGDCIDSRKLEDWKSPSPNVIYYRVNAHDVYRFDLSTGSNQLKYSDVRLFDDHLSPSFWICSPQDIHLRVTDSHHTFTEPLIVSAITKLTREEVADIPPQYRP